MSAIFLILSGCSQAGWVGYYEMSSPSQYVKKFNYPHYSINTTTLKSIKGSEISLALPSDCSGFKIGGLLTPITPPIPLPNFRSWHSEEEDYCGNFTAATYSGVSLSLKVGDKIYNPVKQNLYYDERIISVKYIFPIRAKNIDSGSIIIEKDGEKIEVPFEYKYFKFWY